MEEYTGVKFSYRLVDKEIPEDEVRRYLSLDKRLNLDPEENQGNMSLRLADGFLIKRAGAKMTMLKENDVSMVLGIKDGEVIAAGAVPSSEARMHLEIYKARGNAMAILHFHDDEMLERFQGPVIGPFPYGSPELAEAAGRAAGTDRLFMIRKHGFVLIARNEKELLEGMMRWKRS